MCKLMMCVCVYDCVSGYDCEFVCKCVGVGGCVRYAGGMKLKTDVSYRGNRSLLITNNIVINNWIPRLGFS